MSANKPELLAPAGSLQAMEAAFSAGADAVYMGGALFGARHFADNPESAAYADAIRRAHLFGKKIYLTVNTLLKDAEMETQLYEFIAPLYTAGLDAAIVQDLGVAAYLQEAFPSLPLHASTQMAVSGKEAAGLVQSLGFSRVIAARELSISEIRGLTAIPELELECFVHGALCYAYSGHCLMSSLIGGRSGNRGRCAGVCRLPFSDADTPGASEQYLLNMKDLCALPHLPDLIRAGVCSFKIEGRMRRAEYVAGVTATYRRYIDRYFEAPDRFAVSDEDLRELLALFSRDGLTDGYLARHNGPQMIAVGNLERTSEAGSRSKEAEQAYENVREMSLSWNPRIACDARLHIRAGEAIDLRLEGGGKSVRVLGDVAEAAKAQPLDDARIMQQIKKSGSSSFEIRSLEITRGDDTPIFLPISALNAARREGLQRLEAAILEDTSREIPSAKPSARMAAENQASDMEELLCLLQLESASQLEAIPKEELSSFDALILPLLSRRDFRVPRLKGGPRIRCALPHVVREKDADKILQEILLCIEEGEAEAFYASDLEGLALLKKAGVTKPIIADGALYSMNARAGEQLKMLGAAFDTVPYELNLRELRARDNSRSELIIYGRVPMMVSAQCVKKTGGRCDHRDSICRIRDRKQAIFPLRSQCAICQNVIYNSLPTSLFSEREAILGLGVQAVRVAMTTESNEEIQKVLHAFRMMREGLEAETGLRATRGHFRRGVQ